ncbi:FG-GAP-like repeat-containing protein [Pirellulaceae bacterium SH449]
MVDRTTTNNPLSPPQKRMILRTNLARPFPFAIAVCLLTLSVGCWSRKKEQTNSTSETTWITLWDQSLAALENKGSDDKEGTRVNAAIAGFKEFLVQFPEDAAALQNLAVGYLVQIKKSREAGQTGIAEESEKDCLVTLAKLKQVQPDAAVPLLLESRIYTLRGDFDKASRLLREASDKPKAEQDTWFQLVEILMQNDEDSVYPELRDLLERAVVQSPNNLALNANYLMVLAKLQDSKAAEHLKKCSQLFRPASEIRGLLRQLDLAQASIEKGNWNALQGQARGIRNLLLDDLAFKQDIHYLRREDVLEYARSHSDSLSAPIPVKRTEPIARLETIPSRIPTTENIQAIATEDIDLDGILDFVLATSDRIEVWSFAAPDKPELVVSQPVALRIKGMVFADLDRDFHRSREQIPPSALPSAIPVERRKKDADIFVDTDVDLVIYGDDGLLLLENAVNEETGKREFRPRPLSEGMENLKGIKQVVAIDMDHDSDLDLIVSSESGLSIWSNRGDWTFTDVSQFTNIPPAEQSITSILALDLDRNVVNDFLLGSTSAEGPIMLASNLHGRYAIRDVSWPSEVIGNSAFVDAIDVNRDACWDIIMGGEKGLTLVTMNSLGHASWKPASATRLSSESTEGVLVLDIDNDTYMDAVSWGPTGISLYLGGGDLSLKRDEKGVSVAESISNVINIDFDCDRDEDLIALSESGKLIWLQNQGGNKNHQLEIVLRADEDGSQDLRARCNMHGVGSLLEVKTNGTYQAQIVRGTRTRFGLGANNQADIVRVLWPNGVPNNIIGVDSRVTVFDQQNLGGSCPYLYAWNGERFEFVTDCLWAAPIGLQFAAGVTAPTREWEYLKIDGHQLKPKDGAYVLQITEELWEAAYFDSVKLLAVDHPQDVEIFTNEKVGPAEISEFKIRTVENRRYPRSIIDQNGNDLSEWTTKRDQRYTRTWTYGFNQGLTETHWMEIDFREEDSGESDGSSSNDIVLYLTGWLFPTCTSLNLAMDENPLRPSLMPPSIQVPDESGNWVEVVPYAGFPGGKTKTIAIDLTGLFLCDDQRIRLVSNMELCWDEVFYTRGERNPRTESYVVTELELLDADLHYRGFSELVSQPGNAPKKYDYEQVTKEPIWPPMKGAFTKYGDVTNLIREADDLQVVMGAGDEMTVRFSANVTNLPDGWVRDFVIYNVGWDKDADLNTIHGQDTGPLPFRGMARYPYAPDQEFPNSPAHVEFLKQYQTRFQDAPAFWNQIRDF